MSPKWAADVISQITSTSNHQVQVIRALGVRDMKLMLRPEPLDHVNRCLLRAARNRELDAVGVRREGSAETRQWTALTAPLDRSPIPCMLPGLQRARSVFPAGMARNQPKTVPPALPASIREHRGSWVPGGFRGALPAYLAPLPIR